MTATTRPILGRVPVPEHLTDRSLIGINTAFDQLGPRRIVGTCTHRMIGSLTGTDGYFRGAAANRALTDFGIGGPWDGALDGHIWRWVPWDAAIAPWANGPADHLEGDGVAFVQKFGINAVNRDLRSIELSDGGQHMRAYGPVDTPAQFAAHAHLVAWLHDGAGVPWDKFPIHPEFGIVTYLEHWEFGPKECPFAPVRSQTEASQRLARGIMRMYQTGIGTSPFPTPPAEQVAPERPFSASMDQEFLRQRWGAIRRVYRDGAAALDPGGRIKRYPWNPKWIPCSAWLHRCSTEATWPAPQDWTSYPRIHDDDPVSYIEFANGWLLLHFADRGWRWAGNEEKSLK